MKGALRPTTGPLELLMTWGGVIDAGQGIDRYEVCVGADLDSCSLLEQVVNSLTTSANVSLLPDAADALTSLGDSRLPIEFYVSLKAFDQMGFSTESMSKVGTVYYLLLLTHC